MKNPGPDTLPWRSFCWTTPPPALEKAALRRDATPKTLVSESFRTFQDVLGLGSRVFVLDFGV